MVHTSSLFALPQPVVDLVNTALEDRRPVVLSYVGAGDQPMLSYRGSVRVFDETRLSIWVRNRQGGLCASIGQRPRVALMYRNEATRATYQFQGRATIEEDAAVRERVYESIPQAEKNHDVERAGIVVLIDIDRVDGWAGVGPDGPIDPILMIRA